MTTQEINETTGLTEQQAVAAIEAQTQAAYAALREAERIAGLHNLDFEFSIGDGDGYYNGYMRNGEPTGYWSGWQGSNC